MAVIVTVWHVLMAHRVVDVQKPMNHEMWIKCHVSHCKCYHCVRHVWLHSNSDSAV